MSKKYKVSIIEFEGTDEETAQCIYEQIVPALFIKGVIDAVNHDAFIPIEPAPIPRKRAPRSDRGKKRAISETPAIA